MPFDAIFTLIVLASVVISLATSKVAADLVLMAAATVLILSGTLEPEAALIGFSNSGVITIATLYIVAAGLIETGAVQWMASGLLGWPKKVSSAQLRIFFPTALLSAFTNNTAVVAMFTPAIQEWGERLKIPASKLLIPLSYAAILGGTCTIIGTSTNLIVFGLLQQDHSIELGIFDIAVVGLPITVVGAVFLFLFGNKLLPNRNSTSEQMSEVRQYCVDFLVEKNSPFIGQSVTASGLRSLNSGYLIELARESELYSAIDPNWLLQEGDVLTFIGAPELASELRRIRGISPADNDVNELAVSQQQRCIVEVVLGNEFPALGKTVKDSKFRTRFNAAILSVSRNGKRLPGKLGDQKFKVGDMLLLETGQEFVEQYRFRKDFLLVSPLNNSAAPDFHKVPRALIILGAMIVSTTLGVTSILESVLLAAGAMIVTGCVSASKARRQIDLQVLIVIAASFSLGAAMTSTGAAESIASVLLPESLASPMIALIILYFLTVMFTELITNNAAAILMFPIAESFSAQLGVSILPFAIAIMIAASASFITPLGYQTNLMVYGPGQYRYKDYVVIGTPLSLIVALLTLILVPIFWPF